MRNPTTAEAVGMPISTPFATARYVPVADGQRTGPELPRWRRAIGLCPTMSDAELLTKGALLQSDSWVHEALFGITPESGFLRHAPAHPRRLFACVSD